MRNPGDDQQQELQARLAATDAALARLDELAAQEGTREDSLAQLHGFYELRRKLLKVRAGLHEDHGHQEQSRAYQQLVHELLQTKRHTIVALRNRGVISNDVMHHIERDLDLEDSRLELG